MLKDLPQNTRVTLFLSALFSIPAGYAAGALYAYRPGLAILITGVLTFAAVLPLLRKAAIAVPDPAG